jgi:hypothetical protein
MKGSPDCVTAVVPRRLEPAPNADVEKPRDAMLEGRKQARTLQRFMVQISAVRDPRLVDMAFVENLSSRGARVATERLWEPGSHVDVKSRSG